MIRKLVSATAALLLLGACHSKPTRVTVTPSPASVPTGVIAVNVTVNTRGASCRGETDRCAIGTALEHLLFRGVPGSIQPTPLVADERGARDKHRSYIDGLLGGEAGRAFVVSVTPVGRSTDAYVITIHHTRLRDALVSEGVIRRFGY